MGKGMKEGDSGERDGAGGGAVGKEMQGGDYGERDAGRGLWRNG